MTRFGVPVVSFLIGLSVVALLLTASPGAKATANADRSATGENAKAGNAARLDGPEPAVAVAKQSGGASEPAVSTQSGRGRFRLSPRSEQDIAGLIAEMIPGTIAEMQEADNASDVEKYLSLSITLAKFASSGSKVAAGDYDLIDARKVMSLTESEDERVAAFPSGDRHVVVRFTRATDPMVFKAIDALAGAQQWRWNGEADRFNALPEGDRKRMIAIDRDSHIEMSRLAKEMKQYLESSRDSVDDQAKMISSKEAQLDALQRNYLPFYFLVDRNSSTVQPRRSIGR